jgi:hypothetical protein
MNREFSAGNESNDVNDHGLMGGYRDGQWPAGFHVVVLVTMKHAWAIFVHQENVVFFCKFMWEM